MNFRRRSWSLWIHFLALVASTPVALPRHIITSLQNGTDTGMYNEGFFEGDILLDDPDKKTAVRNRRNIWPKGVIVYKTADVGCPDSRHCQILKTALETYQRKTCLRFREWSGEQDFVEIFYNQKQSGACWSAVGRSGGGQRLSLGSRCWELGIVIHELGHALGFWHEMNRPDRDLHIIVHWSNILPSFKSAFQKQPPLSVNYLGEPFDLKSIMMYDEYAFSKDGVSPTIEAKSGARIGPIWKRSISPADVRRINKLYKCNHTGSQQLGQSSKRIARLQRNHSLP